VSLARLIWVLLMPTFEVLQMEGKKHRRRAFVNRAHPLNKVQAKA
jgi:hypothetical protein